MKVFDYLWLLVFFYRSHIVGKVFHNSYFGNGKGLATFSNVSCDGTEIELLHCHMTQGGPPQCDHTQDVGISCMSKYTFESKHCFKEICRKSYSYYQEK